MNCILSKHSCQVASESWYQPFISRSWGPWSCWLYNWWRRQRRSKIANPFPSIGLFRSSATSSQVHRQYLSYSMTIECIVITYLEVLPPDYGIVYTVHTACLIAKQQLYGVTIGDFSSCIVFVSMKANAFRNGKKKWICFKHLYHPSMILGLHLWGYICVLPCKIFNKVKMLLDKADAISLTD